MTHSLCIKKCLEAEGILCIFFQYSISFKTGHLYRSENLSFCFLLYSIAFSIFPWFQGWETPYTAFGWTSFLRMNSVARKHGLFTPLTFSIKTHFGVGKNFLCCSFWSGTSKICCFGPMNETCKSSNMQRRRRMRFSPKGVRAEPLEIWPQILGFNT